MTVNQEVHMLTPLLVELHWLPFAACIKFISLMLAYKVVFDSAHTYLQYALYSYLTSVAL